MGLIKHAEKEMRLAGLYDEDADYKGMIPKAVMKLVEAHASNGHSGGSHTITLAIFNRVINFKTLSPVTNDPDEWNDVSGLGSVSGPKMWQNRRDPSTFSDDGGKTHYSVDDKERKVQTSAPKRTNGTKDNTTQSGSCKDS